MPTLGTVRICLVALALALVAGCGSTGESAKQIAADKAAEQARAATAHAAAVKGAQTKAYQICVAQLSGLPDQAQAMESRVSVGLTFEQYSGVIGTAKIAYDKMERVVAQKPQPMTLPCLKVGAKYEAGFARYVTAFNLWNTCIGEYNCSISSGPTASKMQAAWTRGAALFDQGQNLLAKLNPAG
ncbi:MAG: hypothetical protein JWQ32_2621 [Marmoricola sp.]|nr:hypothetical protein [Marmoricola sp.]